MSESQNVIDGILSSPLFRTMGWKIKDVEDVEDPDLQALSSALLQTYQSRYQSSVLHCILNIKDPAAALTLPLGDLEWNLWASLVFGTQLLHVLSNSHGNDNEHTRVQIHSTCAYKLSKHSDALFKEGGWTNTLQKLQDAHVKAKASLTLPQRSSDTRKQLAYGFIHQLKGLQKSGARNRYNKFLANIREVILAMSIMLLGKVNFDAKFGRDYINLVKAEIQDIIQEEVEMPELTSLAGMQFTLLLTLSVSPLIVFSGVYHSSHPFSRKDLLSILLSYGYPRPKSLMDIERKMFQGFKDICFGRTTVENLVGDVISWIPITVEKDDSEYFFFDHGITCVAPFSPVPESEPAPEDPAILSLDTVEAVKKKENQLLNRWYESLRCQPGLSNKILSSMLPKISELQLVGTIQAEDTKCLCTGATLTSTMMDYFMTQWSIRGTTLCLGGDTCQRFIFDDSTCMNPMSKVNEEIFLDFVEEVCRTQQLQSLERCFLAVKENEIQWYFALIDFKAQMIQIEDPRGTRGSKLMPILMYLACILGDFRDEDTDLGPWELIEGKVLSMDDSGDGVCVLWCLKHLLEFSKIQEDSVDTLSLTHDMSGKRVQLMVELLRWSNIDWLDCLSS
ncbi:hypothetical protein BT96DRAFT_1026213 [Gymnopus androsaceus JB14]|uniref:Ubiquitin-like protease family profile domain-containing protein n=1 Tax=Gymnopus androsaceus JB14 TaxID=1447944 RepID=A0A6A4GMI8_9AGAR|nr:hypothetical protein BT96DRAFT_1026213 [Gymnopus androsaceus JB14]